MTIAPLDGPNFAVGDSYSLSSCDVDQWEGTNTFAVSPGSYHFTASIAHSSGTGAGCTATPCSDTRVYQADSDFLLTLLFSCENFLRCDANCDGYVNNFDVDAFVLALSDPQGYADEYPECSLNCNNDINGDGFVNNHDVDAFLDCLGA